MCERWPYKYYSSCLNLFNDIIKLLGHKTLSLFIWMFDYSKYRIPEIKVFRNEDDCLGILLHSANRIR